MPLKRRNDQRHEAAVAQVVDSRAPRGEGANALVVSKMSGDHERSVASSVDLVDIGTRLAEGLDASMVAVPRGGEQRRAAAWVCGFIDRGPSSAEETHASVAPTVRVCAPV